MNNNIEFEYKILVNESDFNQLLSLFDTTCVDQTNVYYDSVDHLLVSKKAAMRLRFIEDKVYFTLKARLNQDLLEYEKEVFFKDLNDCDDLEILELLKSYHLQKPFIPLTSLRTIRHYINLEHAQLCFDQNFYNGKIDYEIEYEYFDEHDGLKVFNDILAKINLKYEKNCISKFKRAMMD